MNSSPTSFYVPRYNEAESFSVASLYLPAIMGRSYEIVASANYHGRPPSQIPVSGVWTGFMDNTSAHGVPHIRNARGPVKKIFWILATLACIGTLIHQGYLLVTKYIAYDVAVKVSVEHAQDIAFPAVTICNNNPVMQSKALRNPTIASVLGSNLRRKRSAPPPPPQTNSQSTASPIEGSNPPATETGDPMIAQTNGQPGTQLPVAGSQEPILESQLPVAGTQMPNVESQQPMAGTQMPGEQDKKPNEDGNNLLPEETEADIPVACDDGAGAVYGSGGSQALNAGNVKSHGGRNQRVNFELKLKLVEALADMSYEEKMPLGYLAEDIIVDCEYSGIECNASTDFTSFYNAWVGSCYTFNSNWNKDNLIGGELLRSRRPGPQYGLSLSFNVDQDEYIGAIAPSAGVRIVIHSQDRMPFPEDEGISAGPGYLTLIGITKLNISRYGGRYGDCTPADIMNVTRNVFEELHPVKYSPSACHKTCYQYNAVQQCGCGDPQYPMRGSFINNRNIKACSSDSEKSCVEDVLEQYRNNSLGCDCPTTCNEETFTTRTSTEYWPSEEYRETLFEALASENEKIRRVLNDACDPEKYKKNLGKVVIYFQEFNYESIQETPLYTLSSLISDVGGILGLFIGFSFLTIGEFLELGIDVLIVLLSRLISRRKLSPDKPHSSDPEKALRLDKGQNVKTVFTSHSDTYDTYIHSDKSTAHLEKVKCDVW